MNNKNNIENLTLEIIDLHKKIGMKKKILGIFTETH